MILEDIQYCISWDDSTNPPYPDCENDRWHFHDTETGEILFFQNFPMDWLAPEITDHQQIASYSIVETREERIIPYRQDLKIMKEDV